MNPSDPFEMRLREVWPPHRWRDVSLVVALSGGADSVALMRGLIAARGEGVGTAVAAHFNHGTRGNQSDADQDFVEALCRQLDVPCVSGRSPKSRSDGTESAMRNARYDFLLDAAERVGARYLVTAHTADDQAETIVHRIIRGTGIGGLSGIPRTRSLSRAVSVIRPMLSIRREQVVAYLRRIKQPYREDASNYDVRYTRNRIRHELLPRIEADYNDGVVDALLRLGQLAGEAQQVIFDQVDQLMDECVSEGSRMRASRLLANCVQPSFSGARVVYPYLARTTLATTSDGL